METPGSLPKSADDSHFRMIDVGEKAVTRRRALAEGRITMAAETLVRIREGQMPKGNVLAMAEVAGIMAAKNTSQILPLCHPLGLDSVRLSCEVDLQSSSVVVTCEAITHAKTGVEMEALTGVSAALLSIYDLTKGIDPALLISGIHLKIKEGGKSGLWTHRSHTSPNSVGSLLGIRAAVITVSDRCSRGEAQDRSGPLLVQSLRNAGAEVQTHLLVPDEPEQISSQVQKLAFESRVHLILLTGGTGLSPRDLTPEALAPLWTRKVAGFGELLRSRGGAHTPMAWLSRSEGGLIGETLVITLPGSSKAVQEGWEALVEILPHSLEIISGSRE